MKTLGRASLSSVMKVVLDVAWYLTLAGGIIVALLAAGGRLELWVWFELDPAVYAIESERLGVADALIGEAAGKLVFRSRNVPLLLANFGLTVIGLGAALLIIHRLRQVFRTLVAGTPFVRANADRIRFIGLVIVAMEVARFFVLLGQSLFLKANFAFAGLSLSTIPRLNLGAILLGLVVLVIAGVFRQGTELRGEQELTV